MSSEKDLVGLLRAFSADTDGVTVKSWQQKCMILAADEIERLRREINKCDDACFERDSEIAQAVREREDYNGKHQAACLEIDRLRSQLEAMRSALELARKRIMYYGSIGPIRHHDHDVAHIFPTIDAAAVALLPTSQAGEEK